MNHIYLHPNWGSLQEEKEGGVFETFTFRGDDGVIDYPYIRRYAGTVDGISYDDLVTPRGEGGPRLTDGTMTQGLADQFEKALDSYCADTKVVAEYIRFDPWNPVEKYFDKFYKIDPHGCVFCNDLQKDLFTEEYSSKRRNIIRKAINSNVELSLSGGEEDIDAFIKLYRFTADKYSIGPYYQIDGEFIKRYFLLLEGRVRIGIARYEGKPIAAGIFLRGDDVFHYHFSASDPEYLSLNAISYLLLGEGRLAAQEGCRLMDLGRAIAGSGLEIFKKSMVPPEGRLTCYVGTRVRNREIYDRLVEQNGGPRPNYFPEYRK